MAFHLTRFSGSTLEPASESISIFPTAHSLPVKQEPFIMRRFSGSTLEPCPDSISLDSCRYSLDCSPATPPAMTAAPAAPATPARFPMAPTLSIRIIPTRPTKPLNRNAKPSSISIPDVHQIADMNAMDLISDNGSPWSEEAEEPWVMWDEETQTIYRPERRHAFWDTPPLRHSTFSAYSPTPSFSSASSTSSSD
ncbi:hypothetical protein BDF14DRAFT_1877148 [Spinellus fusiger]|nr:hypothetical protein BDF14DRAFT_1877148 [Spinellus fusiger]